MTSYQSYALGLLRDVDAGPAIAEYLERIDATLAPHGGIFLVHGSTCTQVEGTEPVGDVVVIGFPEKDGARAWYHSDAYQAIVALRTDHSTSQVVLLDGVDESHAAIEVLVALGLTPARDRAVPSR